MIKDKRDNGKSERNETLKSILNNYKGDRKRALKEHPDLETLYDLSDLRENLLEWYPFREGTRLLQVGSGYGALTGVYSEKAAQVDVLDPDAGDLEVNELRQKQYEGRENIRYIQDELCHYVESGAYMQDQMADGAETEAVPDGIHTDNAGYDYVVFVGSLEPSKAAEQIRAAKRCLVSGGELIIAACNPFGLKYWAGARADDHGFSKKTLETLLGTDGETSWYYPMPDIKVPVTIFSDEYLPGKGDLTDTITAYDYPKYLLMDVGEAYDRVCADGQFDQYANGYLVIWSAGDAENQEVPSQAHIQYVKYNRTRREEFQIRTTIYGDPTTGERHVEKTSLAVEGAPHIWTFSSDYVDLSAQHTGVKFVQPIQGSDRCSVRFPYLKGKTWSEQLGEEIQGGKVPADTVRTALEQVLAVKTECVQKFIVTPEFTEVFGEVESKEGWSSLSISNIDALFENILLQTKCAYRHQERWQQCYNAARFDHR